MSQKEISNALSRADETKFLKIGKSLLKETAAIFRDQFPDKNAVIVADKNTYEVAGKYVQKSLSDGGFIHIEPLIIDDPKLYADYDFVQYVRAFLEPLDAIAIAVGSGVINDITKLASHELERSYMCVATAASMDGYAAFGASITKDGAKQTMECAAPKAIIADIDIISKAPAINNASGYADLYAKVPAGADWIFADALGVEAIEKHAWDTVQDGLADALRDPAGVHAGDPVAIELLIEGLMLGGFAMQSLKSSRPASGAEHQFSHTWDMEHHTFHGEMAKKFGLYKDKDEQAPSHGLKVGIGTLTTTALYELVIDTPFDQLDVKKAVVQWKSLDRQINDTKFLFEDEGIKDFVVKQITGKYIDDNALEIQLTTLRDNWKEIREKLKHQIIPYQETKRRLELVGAPINSEQIGITKNRLKETFYKAQTLRSRFTILDVGIRTGYLDQWVEQLFQEGGALF